MGEIGFNRHEFLFELTWWELKAIIKGYRRRERTTWESTRWQTFCILCALGAKINQPEDLQKFTWDDEENGRIITKKDYNELQAQLASANAYIGATCASKTRAEDETN